MAVRRYRPINYPTGAAASVAWGNITGTLADQTDLQSALDAKAASSHTHAETDIIDGSLLARVADNETISGAWTYTSAVSFEEVATPIHLENTIGSLRQADFKFSGFNFEIVGIDVNDYIFRMQKASPATGDFIMTNDDGGTAFYVGPITLGPTESYDGAFYLATGNTGTIYGSALSGAAAGISFSPSTYSYIDTGHTSFGITNYPYIYLQASSYVRVSSGSKFRIADSTNADYAEAYHDGIDFNTDLVNTTDWNVTGITLMNVPALAAAGNVTGANLNIANWDTAYGWGNHASAGYLTSVSEANVESALSAATAFTANNYVFNVDQVVGAGTDNYVLTYDNATGEISLEAAAGGGASALNDLSDVTITSAATGDYLRYSGSAWVDVAVSQLETDINHDNLTGFVANEHIDWTSTSSNFSTSGTLAAGAITGTSFGGITSANLVDKSAAETVSGAWTFSGAGVFSTSLNAVPLARSVTATGNTATTDYGIVIRFTSGSGATFTLDGDPPTNAVVLLDNSSGNSWTIAASTSLIWAKDATTGNRTLADDGVAVAIHRGSGTWIINGSDLLT